MSIIPYSKLLLCFVFLIRAGYVFCDPVLACITISPVLLLNHLPDVINRYNCLRKYATWNDTCNCMLNRSESTEYDPDFVPSADIDPGKKTWMLEATVSSKNN